MDGGAWWAIVHGVVKKEKKEKKKYMHPNVYSGIIYNNLRHGGNLNVH